MVPLAITASGADGVAEGQVIIEVYEQAVFESVFQSAQLASGESSSGRQVVAQRAVHVVVTLDVTATQGCEQEQQKRCSYHGGYP